MEIGFMGSVSDDILYLPKQESKPRSQNNNLEYF